MALTDSSGFVDLASTGELNFTIGDTTWDNDDTWDKFSFQTDFYTSEPWATGYKIKGDSTSTSIDLTTAVETEIKWGVNLQDVDPDHVVVGMIDYGFPSSTSYVHSGVDVYIDSAVELLRSNPRL